MFRFWTSDSRGCDKTTEAILPLSEDYFGTVYNAYDASEMPAAAAAAGAPGRPAPLTKRKRSSDPESVMPPSPSTELDPPAQQQAQYPPIKRIKTESEEAAWPRAAFGSWYGASYGARSEADRLASPPSPPPSESLAMQDVASIEAVKDVVQYQFCHEILVKHNELRLIEQELAKCQIALEQLRRCHLIPYPTDCPTPQQMLDIASGRGTAVRPRPGAAVPKWSAPFGVVDGPYARHYAKWLIPDPVFDGPLSNWPGLAPAARSKSYATADARATRNSITDSSKARASRGLTGQKLQSLSNGYPQPKDRAGPCVLKRSDGKVVKLVCIDCHRDNFSSTQGFINHCRIAHKRDFKSHEEAAVHCGHPIEVDSAASQAAPPCKKNDKASRGPPANAGIGAVAGKAGSVAPKTAPASISIPPAALVATGSALATPLTAGTSNTPGTALPGHVYALARPDSETANTVLQRIHSSYKLCSHATASGTGAAVRGPVKGKNASFPTLSSQGAFVGSDKTPFLSRFLEKKRFGGDLDASVEDAKEVTDFNDASWYTDDCCEYEFDSPQTETPPPATTVKRAPARSTQSRSFASSFDGTVESTEASQPHSSKSTPASVHLSFGPPSVEYVLGDAMDVDLSPIPTASNNAPSLVSDDGEYDDSDDGSGSDTTDTDLDTVSDVAEINTDEDEDQTHDTPQPLRRHSGSVNLRKDESKHVAFVSPVKGSNNGRRN